MLLICYVYRKEVFLIKSCLDVHACTEVRIHAFEYNLHRYLYVYVIIWLLK